MNEIQSPELLSFSLFDDTLLLTALDSERRPASSADISTLGDQFVAPWGDDNLYPTTVMEKIQNSTLVIPILDWKARALYGGGLEYGKLSIDSDGKERFDRFINNEIEEWFDQTDIQLYLQEATSYWYYWYNIWPELTQSRKGDRITFLTCKDSVYMRWGKKEKSGNRKNTIAKAYMSPDWMQYDSQSQYAIPFNVLNTQRNPLAYAKSVKNQRFIYPVNYPSPGKIYYQFAPWHVILDNWLEIAKEIPGFKKALLKNQLSVKYVIHVPEWFWKDAYPDWDSKIPKEKKTIVEQEHISFNNFFTKSNQGKSLLVSAKDELSGGRKFASWKIEAVDDKLKSGMYIEDSQEADAHIFKNMGVDPTLFGSGPGKNNSSAGSGSDKRVAWNNYIIQQKAHQDRILAPLHFVSKYNGWDKKLVNREKGEKLVFSFKSYQIARLDSGEETTPATSALNDQP